MFTIRLHRLPFRYTFFEDTFLWSVQEESVSILLNIRFQLLSSLCFFSDSPPYNLTYVLYKETDLDLGQASQGHTLCDYEATLL